MNTKRLISTFFLLSLIAFSLSFAIVTRAQDDPSRLAAMRAACADDAQKLCPNVQPGGGRILNCLKDHKDSLSDQCRKAAGLPPTNPASNPAPSAPAAPPTSATPATPPAPPPAKSSPAGATQTKSSLHAGSGSGSYFRMKQVQVIAHVSDPALGGKADLPALDLLIPSTWDFKGSVGANTKEGCFADIFAISWEATSPDKSTAFQGAPNFTWQYADDPAALKKLNDPNRRALGAQGKPCPVQKPAKAEDYFRQQILTVFPAGNTVVSVEPFPELNQTARKQLGLPSDDSGNAATRTEAIRARVKFQKNGKDLEEWVTVVVVTRIFPRGRGAFYDCHAIDIMALQAPQGQLDANDKLFKLMISSIRPEPKWQSYSNGFIAKLYQIEAQKEANMDQMIADFQKHVADTINEVTANAERGANNSAFAFDQNIRGVQTFRDPTTGNTMELSNQFDHAWLNGSNEYIMSDDPNFNPNGVLNGNWNQLQVVRPAP